MMDFKFMQLLRETITLPQQYSLHADATAYAAGLLLESQGISSVSDPLSKQRTVAMARELRKHLSEVEMTRKQIKEPLLAAMRTLDEISYTHTQPMREEVVRLEDLITKFDAIEEERLAAESRAREAEIAKRIAEENAARLEAAKASVQTQEGLFEGKQNLESEMDAYAAEQQLQAAEQATREVIIAPMPEPTRVKGSSMRQELKWEVTDMALLYKERPDLCKPPEPKPSAIRATCLPEMPVPGLRLWWEKRTRTRK